MKAPPFRSSACPVTPRASVRSRSARRTPRGLVPGRVTVQQRGLYTLVTELGELTAELAGRFAHEADQGGYPVAGDWVAVAARPREGTATIHDVLPRRTAFIRKAAG